MSYLDSIKEIEVGDYSQNSYDGPPRLYWHNGDRKAGTPGAFYIKADELGGEAPGEPWSPCEKFAGEQGFAATKLKLAIIGYKSQAFIQDGDTRRWLAEWAEGARFQTEILCFAQGIEQAPVVLVVKGMTGKAFTQKGAGLIARYREQLLEPAARQAGRRSLPLWTFWLPLSTLKEGGRVCYVPTGHASTTYTPPAIHPDALDVANADRLFVGDQLYLAGDSIRKEYDGWLRARRGGVEAAEQGDELFEGGQAPAERRAPAQSGSRPRAGVEETDLPW